MRKSFICAFVVMALVVAATVPVAAQDWKGRARLQGKVETEDGTPIEGATITLLMGGEEGQGPGPIVTNKKGRWSVLGLRNGSWMITIEKEGYVPAQDMLPVTEAGQNPPLEVPLQRVEDTEWHKKGIAVKGQLEHANELYQQGQWAAAREIYEQALGELEEDSQAGVILAIAQTYLLEEDLDAASAELQKVLAKEPDNPQALRVQAAVLGKKGDTDGAVAALQGLLDVDPENTEALQAMVETLVAAGRDEEAQQYMDRLPEGATIDPTAYLNRGIVRYNEGDMEGAMEFFMKAQEHNPDEATVYYYRGLAYLAQEQNDLAKADFEKLLEIDPEHPKAAEVQEFLGFLQ